MKKTAIVSIATAVIVATLLMRNRRVKPVVTAAIKAKAKAKTDKHITKVFAKAKEYGM